MAPPRLSSLLDVEEQTTPPGRPGVAADVRALIRELSTANPLWGAPRIHGELQKLGLSVSQSTVTKYMRLCLANIAAGQKSLTLASSLGTLRAMRDVFRTGASSLVDT